MPNRITRRTICPNGKERQIWTAHGTSKKILRELSDDIWAAMFRHVPTAHMHGIPGTSPVTNAMAHSGPYRYTICLDIETCYASLLGVPRYPRATIFESGLEHIEPLIKDTIRLMGLEPKGFNTYTGLSIASPIANAVLYSIIDKPLLERLGRAIYTRYADNLTYSANSIADVKSFKTAVYCNLTVSGLKLNNSKTVIYDRVRQVANITGVGVCNLTGIIPTRKTRRKLRAANHRLKIAATGPNPALYNKLKYEAKGCRKPLTNQRWIKVKSILTNKKNGLTIWAANAAPKAVSIRVPMLLLRPDPLTTPGIET